MAQHTHSSTDGHTSHRPTTTSRSHWWWLLVAPFLVIPASVGVLTIPGVGDPSGGSPRSLLGMVVLVSAALAHVGLYKDAQSQRERDGPWSPRYRGYALGGATTALVALLVLDVSMPGGLLGAVIFALLVGAVLATPVYLGRRFVT